MQRVAKPIGDDLNQPVTMTECLALGAWRRLNAGDRDFSRPMWDLIEDLADQGESMEPPYGDADLLVIDSSGESGLVERMMLLHVMLATGRFRYSEDVQNLHGLLASEGMIGMLQYGRRRFVGDPVRAFIQTAMR